MTPSMWLTLVACVGMATLVVPVLRARHALAPPLSLLLVDMLVWNMSWLAYILSDDPRWNFVRLSAAALVMPLGMDFVLTFVGRRRALSTLRGVVFGFYGIASASSASRFLGTDMFFVGNEAWPRIMGASGVVVASVMAWQLARHHQSEADRNERSHTRLLMMGLCAWLVLSTTDWLHARMEVVPQMSAIGMLVSAAVMAIVMDRVRDSGALRFWPIYLSALFIVAVLGNVLVFDALPTPTAMMLARTVIFVVIGLVAAREVTAVAMRRRRQVSELALVGRVTAQMAHDIKNPLAALKGASQVLDLDRREGVFSPERHHAMMALIVDQVERLNAIVDDYQRVGHMRPHPRPTSLEAIARRVAVAPSVSVHVASPPDGLLDGELVTRALENLVANALHATRDGGGVLVEVRGDATGDWVELEVVDTGCGMDARTAARALDDFFTTKPTGTGLGLALVRRVARAHGGEVVLRSRLGAGTSVTMRLPSAPTPSVIVDHPQVALAA